MKRWSLKNINRSIFIIILLSLPHTIFAQSIDSCVRKHLDYINCKSHNLCSSYEDDDYHKKLISQYHKIITKYPQALTANDYNQLGKEYYFMKVYDTALYYYRYSCTLNDTCSTTVNNIGTIYFDNASFDSSFYYFNKAFSIDPTNQDFLNNIAAYYGQIGEYKKCIKWCKKSLRIGINREPNLISLVFLVTTYKHLGKESKRKYYEKKRDELMATEIGPDGDDEKDCECTKYKPNCDLFEE